MQTDILKKSVAQKHGYMFYLWRLPVLAIRMLPSIMLKKGRSSGGGDQEDQRGCGVCACKGLCRSSVYGRAEPET